jgi:hypothetical protein
VKRFCSITYFAHPVNHFTHFAYSRIRHIAIRYYTKLKSTAFGFKQRNKEAARLSHKPNSSLRKENIPKKRTIIIGFTLTTYKTNRLYHLKIPLHQLQGVRSWNTGLFTAFGASGVPRGGYGVLTPWNSEVLTKLSRIPNSVENTSVTN